MMAFFGWPNVNELLPDAKRNAVAGQLAIIRFTLSRLEDCNGGKRNLLASNYPCAGSGSSVDDTLDEPDQESGCRRSRQSPSYRMFSHQCQNNHRERQPDIQPYQSGYAIIDALGNPIVVHQGTQKE
jgi:hypothetical protein